MRNANGIIFGVGGKNFKFLELYKMERVPTEKKHVGFEDYTEMEPVKKIRSVTTWEIVQEQ